nr:MAG TPA: hypothetical protein [Caudoviricetes sp.]DAU96849.1 MAG TPA: hypothetical protein [Caudoviricetes sp.]
MNRVLRHKTSCFITIHLKRLTRFASVSYFIVCEVMTDRTVTICQP